ncbi:MAG: F510_1955 family glycosylhydrolase [Patescibacteria group bacterium]
MNIIIKNNKIGIFLLLLVGGAIIYYGGSRESEQQKSELIPVSSITHGHGLALDREDRSKLYIATHHGLLLLKDEKELYRVGSSKDDYMGFSVHPTESNIFLSSGHPVGGGNIGFQRSEDKGFTWKKISDGVNGPVDFHAMAVSPANPSIMYGWYQGTLQRSDDGGIAWKIVNKDILAVQLAAHPKDENIIYASTPNGPGVLVSKDKGVTWSDLSDDLRGGQVAVMAINPREPNKMLAYAEKQGGLAGSSDGGETWSNVPEDFEGETVLYIVYSPHDQNTVYSITHKNSIYKSVNGGEGWVKIH